VESSIEASSGSGRLRRRRNILVGIAVLAVLAAAGGLLVSTTIKSPAEVAAQAAPPASTRLTVPASRQVITSTVLAQGVVSKPAEVSQLAGATSGAGGGGGGTSGGLPVVTKIYERPGGVVTTGTVIVEVAGRPLFVFPGSSPAYRDLVPGESGTDVAQLQEGLQSLGFSVGADTIGDFGPGTKSAVAAYYQSIGYSVPAVSAGPKADRGPMVPLAEIVFAPRLPARVVSVAGPVGQEASGSLVTLSMGNPAIDGQLSPGDAKLVRPGQAVAITDAATGLSRRGRVISVGRRTSTSNSISGGVYVPFKVIPDRPLPLSMVKHDVALTINSARSDGPVLAVPEAAVFARADGRTYVTKVTGSRSQAPVPVRIDLDGDGMIAVTPIDGGTLAPGDQVVIGTNYDSGVAARP
jgi:hypothetical protein